MIDRNFLIRKELLKAALEATDAYLGIEKHAIATNMVTNTMLHDFSYHMSLAHDALQQLGELDKHTEYMRSHVETMLKIHGHEDKTIEDLPYTHIPRADFGEVEESYDPLQFVFEQVVEIDEEADKGLAAKAAKSGVSVGTLRKVYKRGVAAWRTGHRPGTTPQQWGMARVNSYIMKGKTYHTADKDLREQADEDLSDDEIEKMVNDLEWEDIQDLYEDDEFEDEEEKEEDEEEEEEDEDEDEEEDEKKEKNKKMNEGLSMQARLKKRQTFARFKGKRGVARGLKLRRASDMTTLQRRAKMAARRSLYRRFLKGRDKSQLSAAEKDRIEQQVARLKNVQSTIAQRMLPKIRSIEQKRLAGYRSAKR